MTARAIYPHKEAFFLDANAKIETTIKDVGLDLGTVKTIRLVVLNADATPAADGGVNARIELRKADNSVFHTISSADLVNLDGNGVYIEHVRGALWDGIREVKYAYVPGSATSGQTAGAIASGFLIYLDSVEVNA